MPFIYTFTGEEWSDDLDEMNAPSLDQFEYLAPPAFGGAKEPVQYNDDVVETATDAQSKSIWSRFSSVFRKEAPQASPYVQKLFGVFCPALRQLGGLRVHCAYDGGNDEGFAWITGLETATGTLPLKELVDRLDPAGLIKQLVAAGLMISNDHHTDRQALEDLLRFELADGWATILLGQGFGTGEYTMYGAFTVDLASRTIRDDRQAQPHEDGNIELRR